MDLCPRVCFSLSVSTGCAILFFGGACSVEKCLFSVFGGAGTGGADAEGNRLAFNGFDIPFLADGLGGDRLAFLGDADAVTGKAHRFLLLTAGGGVQRIADRDLIGILPGADEREDIFSSRGGNFHRRLIPGDFQTILTDAEGDGAIFHKDGEVFIETAAENGYFIGIAKRDQMFSQV